MRSTTRWALAGLVALAAVGAVAVGSATAEAAPSVSSFAGTYVGADPQGWHDAWTIKISDAGRITSSFSNPGGWKGSMSGQVGDDGSYSLTVSETIPAYRDRREHEYYPRHTISYEVSGTMGSDGGGNIVGTTDAGGSFFWLHP